MTNDLLPCPFCGNDDPLDDGMPEASLGVCCGETGCPIDGVVFTRRDWNTRAKPAEVDLDALKREIYMHMHQRWPNSTLLNLNIIEQADFEMDVKVGVILKYLRSSGQLATGKGGGEPAAPTQIDAGELEEAIADLQSRLNISSEITINEGMPMKVNGLSQLSAERLLQAARAHFEKSKGGV